MLPHVKPTTTPASTILRQGYGKRLTAATMAATPMVTDQLTIVRFFVAYIKPMLYNGASKKCIQLVPFWPGMSVKDRLTTSGLNFC